MGFIKEPDPKEFMLQKISASGLTGQDAITLGFNPCTNTEQEACPALKDIPFGCGFSIPYHTADGKRLQMFRFRYGLPKLDANGRLMKYAQPLGSAPAVYLPQCKGVNWKAIQHSAAVELIITEGELKAACATKAGHVCIGLGGVWNFRSTALDIEFLPQLEEFTWTGRKVWIVYDSDSVYNLQVQKALNALARLLTAKRAEVMIAVPPEKEVDGQKVKVGLDDYIVDGKGKIHADLLQNLLDDADSWEETSEIYKLNAEVAYIETPSMVVVFPQASFPKEWRIKPEFISPQVFVKQRFYTRMHTVVAPDGKETLKRTAECWFGDPRRRCHHNIVYAPGQPAVIDNQFNMWQGWPNVPARGDVKPFLDLMDTLFPGKSSLEREWFLNWLAYPIKYPGAKLNTACLLWGLQGTGKSAVGVTMQAVYGENNCSVPGQNELERDFNSWLADKQFILAEEITGNDARRYVSKLKHLVTGRSIHINKKGIEPFDYPNKANFLFTSNYSNALYVDEDDRRYFVWELTTKLPIVWWQRYSEWLYKKNGAAHLHQWFIDRDVSGFEPNAAALVTKSHNTVVAANRSELDQWVWEVREDPDGRLRRGDVVIPFRLWTTQELYDLFVAGDPNNKKATPNTLGRALARAGFQQANNGNWILTEPKHGCKRTVWAIRNVDDAKLLQGAAQLVYWDERKKFQGRKF